MLCLLVNPSVLCFHPAIADGVLDEETASNTRQSAQQLLKKAIEADSRQAVAGAAPGSVLKAGELTASLCSLRV
jgi:hypothetical protein